MNNYVLEIVLFLFLISVFIGCRINKNNINNDFFSKEVTNNLKGILIILVILHHISQGIDGSFVYDYLKEIGYIVAGLFFFISGYGLMINHILKSNYKDNFIKKHVLKVLVYYIVIGSIYYLYLFLNGKHINYLDNLASGLTFLPFAWFAIEIVIWYVIFYCSMCLFNKKYHSIMLSEFIFYVIMVFVFRYLNFGSWWYNSCHMFVLGSIFALYKDSFINYVKDKYLYCIIFSILGVVILSLFNNSSLARLLLSVMYLLLILILLLKVKLSETFTIVGKSSLSIYLVHGVILTVLRDLNVLNEIAYVLLTLLLSIVLGIFLDKTISKLTSKW